MNSLIIFIVIVVATTNANGFTWTKATPKICRKDNFQKIYVAQNRSITKQEANTMKKCFEHQKSCQNSIIKLLYTYAISENGKHALLLYVVSNTTDGCWGNYLQMKVGFKTKIVYFNFKEKSKLFLKTIYYELGSTYEIKVQSLPYGRELSFKTTAPNECELEVLNYIYDKLQNGVFYRGCNPPGFIIRHELATKVCKLHPENSKKRSQTIRYHLMEKDCKLFISPSFENEIHSLRNLLLISRANASKLINQKVIELKQRWLLQ